MMVGMRTIKTAISVGICIFVLELVGITPIFASIAALFSVETDVPTSYKAGLTRIFGTLAGAIVGSVFVIISCSIPIESALFNALIIPIGLIFVIKILSMLKLNKSIFTGGIVYLLLMIQIEGPLLEYVVTRTLTTVFGVVVALVINRFFFPNGIRWLDKQSD